MTKREVELLTVTEGAKQRLKELLLASTNDPDFGVRLVLKASGQTGLVLDREELGDDVVEHDGSKVLLVGPEVDQLVVGATLDTEDTPEGTKFVISKG
jgi:Fe-S cluster assembly iron-binding protein IscA